MADKYIGDITKKTPNLADYLVAVDGADAYQTLVSDVAKKIIEDYQGSNLGGVAQSIQAGFDVVFTNNLTGTNNRQGWTEIPSGADLDTYGTVGVYHTSTDVIAKTILNRPQGFDTVFKLEISGNGKNKNFLEQKIVPANKTLNGKVATRRTTGQSSGVFTWSDWNITPTATEVTAIANRSAKNLLNVTGTNQTINGVTFTKNADGSVTLNGTSTAAVTYILKSDVVESGRYILSSVETGESDVAGGGMYAKTTGGTGTTGGTRLASALRNTSVTFTNQVGTVWLYYGAGVTFTNYTVYPMLRFESVQDDTYVPYGMTNAELTDIVNPVTGANVSIGEMAEGYTSGSCRYIKLGRLVVFEALIPVSGSVAHGTAYVKNLPQSAIAGVGFIGANNSAVGDTVNIGLATSGGVSSLVQNGAITGTKSLRVAGAYISAS